MRLKFHSLVMSMFVVAIGGCAVSGGSVTDSISSRQGAVVYSAIPPLPDKHDQSVATSPSDDKFGKTSDEMLVVASASSSILEPVSADNQAYADETPETVSIEARTSSLKPYAGRWVLQDNGARGKVQRIGAYLGLSDQCELLLEDQKGTNGYKATGNSACPTSLFMLDSWIVFDRNLVLRDHMGDVIVKLKSRGAGIWIGVNNEGKTLVLKRS